MAGIGFADHVTSFSNTLERQGATVIAPIDLGRRPATVRVQLDGNQVVCLLYLWTVTGGGKNRPADERRIQITGTDDFRLEPGTRTFIGGYSADEQVWCFWDPLSHVQFSLNSPSFQVNRNTLESAANRGIATQLRGVSAGEETIVAVHPDALATYVLNAREWHGTESSGDETEELLTAGEEEFTGFIEQAGDLPEAQRRERVVEVIRAFRDAQFRPSVLRAYGYRCAIAQTSMRLVEAAHIVPVSHPQGTDDVTNGLALSVQHHRAYDAGLIGIRGDYSIVINPNRATSLRSDGLADGLDDLIASIEGKAIRLPTVNDVRPDPRRLRLAMQIRGFPQELIG